MSLRALTLWRPWSFAVTDLGKRIENRPWSAPQPIMNQYLALHAGKTYDKGCVALMRELGLPEPPPSENCPQGIVAVCKVRGSYSAIVENEQQLERLRDVVGGIYPDQRQWVFGPSCWVLDEVTPFEPVPCKGAQGLWTVPEDILVLVRERWNTARKVA